MGVNWVLKQFEDVSAAVTYNPQYIFMLEAEKFDVVVPYTIADINRILESSDYQDNGLKLNIIARLIELQLARYTSHSDTEDRYAQIVDGLSPKALQAIRNAGKLKYDYFTAPADYASNIPPHDIERFVEELLFDWFRTKPKDILTGPHPGGMEMPDPK